MYPHPLRPIGSPTRPPRCPLMVGSSTARLVCIVTLLLSNAASSAAQTEWAGVLPITSADLQGVAAVTQLSKVRPTDAADNSFGQTVAIDGDTAVIGIQAGVFSVPEGEPIGSGGAAYVFRWSGAAWVAQARLQPLDGVARKSFGTSVAISGGTIVVGAYADSTRKLQAGSAYVFVGSGSNWTQTAKLEAQDSTERDNFGWSVTIDGSDILVGAPGHDLPGRSNAGAVYLFRGSGPSQGTKFTAGADAGLGSDLDADQGTFIVGTATRPAYLYRFVGPAFTQVARLVPASGNGGGGAVAVSGNTALVGSPSETIGTSGFRQGAAYLFTEQGGTWSQAARLTASNGAPGDEFGHDVALCSGAQALVGVPSHNVGTTAVKEGAAYAFDGQAGWRSSQTQDEMIVAPDAGLGERDDFAGFAWEAFGWSVACSGNTLLVSAYSDTDDSGTFASRGSAYFLARAVTPTPTPTNLTVLVNRTNVRFDWTPPAQAVASYLLEVGFTSGATSIPPIQLDARTTVDFQGAPEGRYYARVRARLADGTLSGPSNEVVVAIPGFCRRSAPPANFSASAVGGVATLTWEAVSGATRYDIEVGSVSDASDLLTIAVDPSSTRFTAAAPAGVYFLRVRATTFCGQSSPSAERRLRVGGAGASLLTVNDLATTPSNEEVVIPVLANDRTSLGGRLSIVSVVQPANGMADANPDGTITYEAADGFVGRDQFTYTVEDELGGFDTATVFVDVASPTEASDGMAADARPISYYVQSRICYWADEYETQIRIGGTAFMQENGDSAVEKFRMAFKVYYLGGINVGAAFQKQFEVAIPSDATSYHWTQGGEVGARLGFNYRIMVKMTWVRNNRRDFNQTLYVGQCDAR